MDIKFIAEKVVTDINNLSLYDCNLSLSDDAANYIISTSGVFYSSVFRFLLDANIYFYCENNRIVLPRYIGKV